ncbi:MAG TPA: DegT/DnrJ/EryC1/StrS family aminotransferase [Syntrophobacteria bacterium]|nr:DegT/DnrJ/EryC1/StrS family aminotransferase [Syntrophobacteria bacterium]
MKIPLLDLKAQYRAIREEIQRATEEVFESQQFILGPKVEALEKALAEYCQCRYAVGVSSGTDALLAALMSAGIGPGHGVITAPFTFFASAGSIVRVGARPFFVDIDSLSYTMSPQALESFVEDDCRFDTAASMLVHRRTGIPLRAIIPVHLYGQCAHMDPIVTVARRYGLLVIEDAAQAIGAGYPSLAGGKVSRAGSMGDLGGFSFYPSKNLGGVGDGGMVTTSDETLARKLRMLRVHGENTRYQHQFVGGNFRLDALQAAVLLVKLKHLDSWTARRRDHAASYDSLFRQSGLTGKGLVSTPQPVWDDRLSQPASKPQAGIRNPHFHSHIYNQYVIRAQQRDALRTYLAEQGIGTEIYYPLPLHQQECFRDLGYRPGGFPESERAAAETLALPVYPELEKIQLEYVVNTIADFYGRRSHR